MNSLFLDSPLISDNKDLLRLGAEANQSNWMFAKMHTPGTEMHIEPDLFWSTAKQTGLPNLVCVLVSLHKQLSREFKKL